MRTEKRLFADNFEMKMLRINYLLRLSLQKQSTEDEIKIKCKKLK